MMTPASDMTDGMASEHTIQAEVRVSSLKHWLKLLTTHHKGVVSYHCNTTSLVTGIEKLYVL